MQQTTNKNNVVFKCFRLK